MDQENQMPEQKMPGERPNITGRRQIFGFSIHPLVLIVGVLLAIFAVAAFLNHGSTTQQISVDEFMRGIKQNKYSGIVIQDTGEILAQDKYLVTADSASDAKYNTAIATTNLKEQTLDGLMAEMKPQDPLAQLRAVVNSNGAGARLVEVIIGPDYIIGHKATGDDEIVHGINEQDFMTSLQNNNINTQDLSILLTYVRSSTQKIDMPSFNARASGGQFAYVYQIDGTVYGRVKDASITTYSITWDGGIRSFATTMQNEGISLAAPNFRIGSIIVATIPWGDIISIMTLVGFVVLGIFLFRGIQSSGNGLMKFGQSKARMFWGTKPDVTFKDVAGIDEAKEELNEIVQFLRDPGKFRKLGARIPKGVLMVGSPGTGKTLLARAIAGEAGVPFFHTSGSEFEEMLVGAGASRVRDLFDKAKRSAPALIFIDEIDAVARKRGTTVQSSTTEQTLNQILVEMDGFEQNTNVIVIAATNRPDVLDPAILRPGRFDRRVVLDLPDAEGRKQILEIHAKNKPLAKDVDLEKVAKRTIGFSGAELENTLNEAAIIAAKHGQTELTNADIEEAATKVTMGPAKLSKNRAKEELKLVAVHEAGHAVVSKYVPQADPVHRVSIISRGMAGGVTHFLPQDDNRIIGKERLFSRIVVALGGRAAEQVALNDISTGASSDIDSATNIVRNMVQKFGMSEKLGLVKYGESNELQYLGYGYGEQRDYSEDTSRIIDEEVRRVMREAYEKAVQILTDHKDKLDQLTDLLLEKEVVESDEFDKMFTDNKLA